jgi:hypothetical protein
VRAARLLIARLTVATVASLSLTLTLGIGTGPAAALGTTTTTTAPTATTTTTTTPTTTTTVPGATTTVPAATTTVPAATTTVPAGTTTTPGPTTTTTAPAATTTTIPPGSGVPSVPTGGPPTPTPAPGSPPPTPPDTGPISLAVDADLARLAAISDDAQVAAAVTTDTRMVAMATVDQARANATAKRAARRAATATARAATARTRLKRLALAAYTGESSQPVSTVDPQGSSLPVSQEARFAGVTLTVVVSDQEKDVQRRAAAVVVAASAAKVVDARLAVAQASLATAQQALSTTRTTLTAVDREAVDGGNAVTTSFTSVATPTGLTLTVGSLTTVPSAVVPTTPGNSAGGTAGGEQLTGTTPGGVPTPTILGSSTVTAAELAAWFASAGHAADTTVPIAQLAQDYLTAGAQTGVRGDLAFAQSLIETGNFDFPAGGQLTAADNNFAGIGACDSCVTGWKFPDAQTGVSAQEQLLEAYASRIKVPTPLVGPVGVGGCCTTWVSLAGKWASSLNYGVEILTVYQQILDWVIPQRLATAGLAPAPAPAPAPATPVPAAAPAGAAASG